MKMGGGGGTKSKSQSFSGSGQKWATPIARAATGDINQVYRANQPGLQALTDLTQKQIVPQAFGAWQSGQAGASAARNYNMGILNQPFGSNPELQNIINSSRRDIMDDVGGMFARSGRYGSGAHQDVTMSNLADMESQYRYNDYLTEIQRRAQAAESLTGANQQELNQTLGAIGMGAEIPYTGSSSLANSLGALFSGGAETSTSKTKGPGLLSGLMSAGASIGSAALMACERHLKTGITLLRREPDGLGWYGFSYKRAPDIMLEGPMADEVEKLRPWALGPKINGIRTVNMAKLSDAA
jgi:hypothetical protein